MDVESIPSDVFNVVGELEDSLNATWELHHVSPTRIWFSNNYAIKTTVVAKCASKRVVEVLFEDHTNRKEWDPRLVTIGLVEKNSRSTNVVYRSYHSSSCCLESPRDYCILQYLSKKGEKFIISQVSTTSPACPPVTKFVRGFFKGGYIINPIDANKTEITFIILDIKLEGFYVIPQISSYCKYYHYLSHIKSMGGLRDYLKQTHSKNIVINTHTKNSGSLSLLNSQQPLPKNEAPTSSHINKEEMTTTQITPITTTTTKANDTSATMLKQDITKKIKTKKSKPSSSVKEIDIYENLRVEFKNTIDEAAKLLLELDSTPGWQHISNQNNIEITKKDVGASMSCARGVGKINAPPIAIVNFIKDFDRRGEWDLMLDSSNSKVIQQFNEQTALFRITFKRVIPTSSRDFCTLSQMRHLGNNKWLIIAKSVIDSRCPEQKGFVRAELVVGGYIIAPSSDNPNSSIVTYITQANLNGYIPQSIVKIAMVNQPLCIDGIRKIIEKEVPKYNIITPVNITDEEEEEEEQEEEEEEKEKIEEEEEKTHEQEVSKASQLDEGEEEIVKNNTNTSTATTVVVEENNIATSEVISTPESTTQNDSTKEELFKNIETLITSSKVLHTDNKLWKTVRVKDDVIIQRGHNTSTFRGIGEINSSPEAIKDLVFDVENSLQYDPLLKSAVVVESINSTTKIVHLIYQTRMCLVTTARDFVVLYHWAEIEKNMFIVVAQSVKHSNVSETPNCIRGEVLTAGFLIKPKDEINAVSIVSYISSTDLKNLPATVMNIVQEKQPLVIAAVRQNLTGSKKAQ